LKLNIFSLYEEISEATRTGKKYKDEIRSAVLSSTVESGDTTSPIFDKPELFCVKIGSQWTGKHQRWMAVQVLGKSTFNIFWL